MWKQETDQNLCEDLKELIRSDIEGQLEFPDKLKLQLELTKLEVLALVISELQKRGGNDDNSMIIFLIAQQKHML